MCSVTFCRRSRICVASVQMRLLISNSSKSARCISAEKLWPRPTGSIRVNWTRPGVIFVSRRSKIARTKSRAVSRLVESCSTRIEVSRGKFSRPDSVSFCSASKFDTPASGATGNVTEISPTGNADGSDAGAVQPFAFSADQFGKSSDRSLLMRASSDAIITLDRHRDRAVVSSASSCWRLLSLS